jgi:hypothetical protein
MVTLMSMVYLYACLMPIAVHPCVILSTDSGRLVRPVQYLATNEHRQSYIEWIGPMEQVYMDIAATPDDFRAGETTHQELYPDIMLSETAMCTPFSGKLYHVIQSSIIALSFLVVNG